MVISASDDDSIARAAAPGGVTQQPPWKPAGAHGCWPPALAGDSDRGDGSNHALDARGLRPVDDETRLRRLAGCVRSGAAPLTAPLRCRVSMSRTRHID